MSKASLEEMLLLNEVSFNLTLNSSEIHEDTPKLIDGAMEGFLVVLYSCVCLFGLIANTALMLVILGMSLNKCLQHSIDQ